jgi:hypothetical protein
MIISNSRQLSSIRPTQPEVVQLVCCFKLWNEYVTKLLNLFKETSEKKVCRLFNFGEEGVQAVYLSDRLVRS